MPKRWGYWAVQSMDIQTNDEFGRPWDFNKAEMREHAIKRIEQGKPYLLIGSPMCSHWSLIMNSNWGKLGPEVKEEMMRKARTHPNSYVIYIKYKAMREDIIYMNIHYRQNHGRRSACKP